MGCCVGGCFRLLFMTVWRALAAALLAVLLSRIDSYIEGSPFGTTPGGKAWRMYRDRTRKKPRVVDTQGGPTR